MKVASALAIVLTIGTVVAYPARGGHRGGTRSHATNKPSVASFTKLHKESLTKETGKPASTSTTRKSENAWAPTGKMKDLFSIYEMATSINDAITLSAIAGHSAATTKANYTTSTQHAFKSKAARAAVTRKSRNSPSATKGHLAGTTPEPTLVRDIGRSLHSRPASFKNESQAVSAILLEQQGAIKSLYDDGGNLGTKTSRGAETVSTPTELDNAPMVTDP